MIYLIRYTYTYTHTQTHIYIYIVVHRFFSLGYKKEDFDLSNIQY